jgi:hypothetical protein
MPFLAVGTPTFVDAMVGDDNLRWGWDIDHLSLSGQRDSSQALMTLGTIHGTMLCNFGRL